MVNYFEQITEELYSYEKEIVVPEIINILKNRIGKENHIKNSEIKKILDSKSINIVTSRIRKVIQYIRINGDVECLMATSKGYYISESKEELDKYIESLHQRSNSIEFLANQIQFQLDKKFRKRKNN